MIGSNLEQQLRVLLSQANVARDVEHDQRLKVERRAAQMRGLLFEMAQRLLPNELDDLWKSSDVNDLPDDQFVRWMTSQLNAQVFEYRALCRAVCRKLCKLSVHPQFNRGRSEFTHNPTYRPLQWPRGGSGAPTSSSTP